MKIAYGYYQLDSKSSLNACSSSKSRTGALLRVVYEDGRIGYADCHPWPELGDLPIQEQLACLFKGRWTPLLDRAFFFAQIDAAARSKAHHLLQSTPIPESHFFIGDLILCSVDHLLQAVAEGFTHVKLKMGRDLQAEADQLLELFPQLPLKIRIDFNESLNLTQFTHFLDRIAPLKYHIDFIEDPIPFQVDLWEGFQQQGWTLACDRHAATACCQPHAASVLIIKPAIHGPELYLKETSQRKIITTNLGHPIEQVAAAYICSCVDPHCLDTHGLLSHRAYRPTLFSSQLNWRGPQFTRPKGTGCGFNDELAVLPWEEF
jgi:O-succinylbenzoate synthase